MLDRLRLAGRSMMNRMAQLETISNNLANISTNGFKRDQVFQKTLNEKINSFQSVSGVPSSDSAVDFTQGTLVGTNRPLDVALSGDGLFVIEAPNGEAYTRDGRFTINNEGLLSTLDGYAVLGEGGPVELDLQQKEPTQLLINEAGEILLDGQIIDKLKIVSYEDQAFKKLGSNLMELSAAGELNPAANYAIKQGFLEESNVNPIAEMIAMMDVMHQYQMSEKVIKLQDGQLGKAVNEVGRVS